MIDLFFRQDYRIFKIYRKRNMRQTMKPTKALTKNKRLVPAKLVTPAAGARAAAPLHVGSVDAAGLLADLSSHVQNPSAPPE